MNTDEAEDLLVLAAIYDNRNAGPMDIAAWAMALKDVTHADATMAMVEHYTKNPDRRAMPGDIWAAARRMVKARQSQNPSPLPPPELADKPLAELAWRRAQEADIAAGTYVAPPPPALVKRDLRALAASFQPLAEEPEPEPAEAEATPDTDQDGQEERDAA